MVRTDIHKNPSSYMKNLDLQVVGVWCYSFAYFAILTRDDLLRLGRLFQIEARVESNFKSETNQNTLV